ncbi:four helix bundle protein [Deferribacter autotrophicus]|uniref:Four helix bundle protein n=1 Tax=Deferribacter autotrophicus TaxID=500465 RepID=A0A5A8F6P2_9BACT|nr:four helix bundle protein [Deferribacter autotrophicus]KAA0257645.1 four helix bundle protein [Deferribacter autotrophicus]
MKIFNIPQGKKVRARNSHKEFKQFCGIARGSVAELRYFIMLSYDLGYVGKTLFDELINKTEIFSKMIYGIIKTLENKL